MIAIISLLLIVFISALILRVATIALAHTGLSGEVARFQARSAFTGAGFTTNESEHVVNHPVRRRIVLILMLLGNVGFVSGISTFIITFVSADASESVAWRFGLLVSGLALLWVLTNSKWVDRHLSRLINWALNRYTDLDVRDYSSLMHLAGDYRIVEIEIEADDWIADQTLGETKLRAEGIVVLGITRQNGEYLGVPNGQTRVQDGDILIVYGRLAAIQELDQRRKTQLAKLAHDRAVREQRRIIAKAEQRQQMEAVHVSR